MQVSIETTSGLERRLTITVPFERFESRITQRLNEAARNVRLPGFRPGKVPVGEVKRRFGVSIRAEVISDTMQASFNDAVRQENLRPAGAPSFDLANPDVVERIGEDLKYTAVFEVLPEVELKPFAELAIERPAAEVTEADIDRMIDRLRQQKRTFEAVPDRAAEAGDQLAIDFEGRIDGEVFGGGSATNFPVVLGEGRLLKQFEDALVGAKPGEVRTFPVDFPEDYGNAELKGKQAQFTATVHEVRAPRLPEVDDAFFKEFGVEAGGLDTFRSEVRESMQRELEAAVSNRVKNQVFEGLAGLHAPQLPLVLVANEVERMRRDMMQRMGVPMELYEEERRAEQQRAHDHAHHDHDHAHDHEHDHGHDHDHAHDERPPSKLPQLPDTIFQDSAERRVRIGLVVAEIIRNRSLQPDDEKVRAMIRRLASAYNDPESVVKWYYSNEQQLAGVEQAVLEEQVVDLVIAESKVTDVPSSYDDLIAQRPNTGGF